MPLFGADASHTVLIPRCQQETRDFLAGAVGESIIRPRPYDSQACNPGVRNDSRLPSGSPNLLWIAQPQ